MASIRKQKSGTWRVQVRRKGRTVSETFVRHDDAKRWGVDAERQIDRGETPTLSKVGKLQTFGDLIELHIADMTDVGKPPRRSKDATLAMLKRRLGARNKQRCSNHVVANYLRCARHSPRSRAALARAPSRRPIS